MPDKKLPTLPKRKIKRPVIDDIEDHLLSQHQDKGPPLFVLSSGKGVHRRFDSHDNMMTNTMKDLKLEKKYQGLGNMLSGHKKGPMRLTRDPSFSSNQLYGFQFFSKPTDAQRKYLKDFIIDKRLKSEDYQLHMPDSDENALRLFRRSIDNLGKKKKVRKGLGAAGSEDEEEAGAKIAAIIATLYPQMNKAQQTQAKLLISRITKRPDKQVLRDIAKFLARFGASNPAISKKIEALFKNINKQPIAVAVEQSPKTPEKAQEKADEKLDGFVTKMMAFLTASGLIISAKESRKIRLKEAKSGKEGIPKSGDKEIPTTAGGIPKRKKQQEIIAILTTKHDPRVDDVCIPFHGLPFKLGDPLRPKLPLHYGCRCTWIDKETGKDLGQL